MTPEQLQAIKERLKNTTDGFWLADTEEWPGNEKLKYWVQTHYDGLAATINKGDAQFIAHARQDIPALVAEVERLNALLQEIGGDIAEHTAKTLRKLQ